MDLSTIKVEVSVSEQVLNTIQVGDKVSVLMTAASETPLTGTVANDCPCRRADRHVYRKGGAG